MLDMSDMEIRRIIYTLVMFGFAYFLAFKIFKMVAKDPKSK